MFQIRNYRMISTLFIVSLSLLILEKQVETKTSGDSDRGKLILQVPNVSPDHPEQYLCMARRLPVGLESQYIVGFNPQGSAKKVHHMLMYGCQFPGLFQRDSPNMVWDCGDMLGSGNIETQQSFEKGPICRGKQSILYGWALDAPALKLPEGVGFKVGGVGNDIQFLVLQVHYGQHGHKHSLMGHMPNMPDNSGLVLDVKPANKKSGITKQAGVLILLSYGQVQEGKSRHEIWCDIEDDIVMHPFRYRVHTHKLGTRVMGAKVSSSARRQSYGEKPGREDLIIGDGDPQQPQMFYPVKEKDLIIKRGDTVYASCEFNNNRSHIVKIGATGDDEMCNFYLMYWTDSPKLLTKSQCYGVNPRNNGFLDMIWQ